MTLTINLLKREELIKAKEIIDNLLGNKTMQVKTEVKKEKTISKPIETKTMQDKKESVETPKKTKLLKDMTAKEMSIYLSQLAKSLNENDPIKFTPLIKELAIKWGSKSGKLSDLPKKRSVYVGIIEDLEDTLPF
jgi:hypothetical protein